MSNVYLRLLQDTNKSNLIIRDKYIWCPMRVGDFAKSSYMGIESRNIYKIIQYVYAKSRLIDTNFDTVIPWAEILLKFDENRWLKDNLESYVLKKYNKYLQEWPEDSTKGLGFSEIIALNVFHDDHDMNNLINSLIGYGALKTQPDWDSNFIYFRSVKTTELSLQDKKRYVVKKSVYKSFFWMDVGAWSSNSAIIGIITPHEVAMYDIYGSKKDMANCKRATKGSLAADVLKSFGEVLPGGAVFYQDFKNIEPIRTPMTNDEIIFVIPDLHIHLFKGFSADNFKQSGSEKSLDVIMAKVLSVIDKYKSEKTLSIIQVGDLYELWESAMLLCIGLNPDWESVDKTYLGAMATFLKPNKGEMIQYIKSIEAEAKRRKLHEIFDINDLNKLRQPWAISKDGEIETNAMLKDVWKKMQLEIEKLHQVIFKKETRGKFDIWGNQTIIAGNHDSFLDNVYARSKGINDIIRFEHLHYNDNYNKPSNMKSGQFMTILNVIAETKGFGDQIKAMEASRRPAFLKDVATINFERYKQGKPMYDLVVTGHTHRAYAQVIRMKINKSKSTFDIDPEGVRYDQGWQKQTSKEQTAEVLKLARANQNAILGGIGALGWQGFGTAFCLWVCGVDPSKPFPV